TAARYETRHGEWADKSMLTRFLILVVTVNTVLSMLLLKRAVAAIGMPESLSAVPRFFMAAAMSPLVYASLLLQVFGYACWMIVITQEKLGVAVAISGSGFYLLMALASWFVYGETLTRLQWLGLALITIGVLCVALKPD